MCSRICSRPYALTVNTERGGPVREVDVRTCEWRKLETRERKCQIRSWLLNAIARSHVSLKRVVNKAKQRVVKGAVTARSLTRHAQY